MIRKRSLEKYGYLHRLTTIGVMKIDAVHTLQLFHSHMKECLLQIHIERDVRMHSLPSLDKERKKERQELRCIDTAASFDRKHGG